MANKRTVKETWPASNLLYPVPSVMVSFGADKKERNITTVTWTGTLNSDPPMCYISLRPESHAHGIIKKDMSFVINLTTVELVRVTDFNAIKSGKKVDKFTQGRLTPIKATHVAAPMIEECPVNIECRVTHVMPLGTHDMFMAEIMAVHVNENLIDERNHLRLDKAELLAYAHGYYYGLGKSKGKFGFSVHKKKKKGDKKKTPRAKR